MTTKITSRERMRLALSRQEADRIPKYDSIWGDTWDSWKASGALNDIDPEAIFDWDLIGTGWIGHTADIEYMEVLKETDEWRLQRDGNMAVLKYWKHKSGTPEHVEFGVKTPDDWLPIKDKLLATPIEKRVSAENVLKAMQKAKQQQRWFTWTGLECFEATHPVIGHEGMCIAALEEPDWLADIFETQTDLSIRGLDYLESQGVKFDGGWIYGDLAYTNGPFLSPKLYRELVLPSHKRHIAWFKDRGMPVIWHSCGYVKDVIPDLITAGIDCLQALEAKVGNDVRVYKPMYGDKIAFMGNIDATKLITNNKEIIEAEIAAKIPIAKKGGGYIYHSDHSIPPQITWDNYLFVLEMVKKYGDYP